MTDCSRIGAGLPIRDRGPRARAAGKVRQFVTVADTAFYELILADLGYGSITLPIPPKMPHRSLSGSPEDAVLCYRDAFFQDDRFEEIRRDLLHHAISAIVAEQHPRFGGMVAAAGGPPGPLSEAILVETKERLVVELQGLGEREQMILSLYYVESLNYREIGAILDLTESRTCQIVRQALGILGKRMRAAA